MLWPNGWDPEHMLSCESEPDCVRAHSACLSHLHHCVLSEMATFTCPLECTYVHVVPNLVSVG
jgi:hypothetical protein